MTHNLGMIAFNLLWIFKMLKVKNTDFKEKIIKTYDLNAPKKTS